MTAAAHSPRLHPIARYLHLRPGEAPRVLHFALLGLLLQLGLGIGFSAGDALFLVHVGSKSLPIIFLLTPAVMLLYTPLFSWAVSRLGMQRACQMLVATLVGVGIALYVLIDIAEVKSPILYYAIKLYLASLYISIYSAYWLLVDEYFSIDDGKRLYPLFSVGCSLGTAMGALLVSVFANSMSVGGFFLVWVVIAAATMPVLVAVSRKWIEIVDPNARILDDDQPRTFVSQQTHVVKSLLTSRFALFLSAMLFLTLLITNIAEYQYSAILEKGRSEAELATILGRLYGIYHLFNIVVCLFAFSPMVRRFGVKNVALILPVVYTATFVLLFFSSTFVAAAVAFWAYHSVLTAIEYNNQNLLFNALPAQTRRGIRTLIEGLCEPFASFVAGLFLLIVQDIWGLRQIAGITLLVAALLIGAAFGVRSAYPEAMSRNMRLGWLNLGAARKLRISADDGASLDMLADAAAGPPSPAARDALVLLIEAAPARAAPVLLDIIRTWPPAWHDRLERLVHDLLALCDERVFAETIGELLRLDRSNNPVARNLLARLSLPLGLDPGDCGRTLRDELAGLRIDRPHVRAKAMTRLGMMLAGDAVQRRAAAELLGLLGDASFSGMVLGLLDDNDEQVRLAALCALRQLAVPGDSNIAEAMLVGLADFNRAERRIAFAILDDCADAEQLGAIVGLGPLLSPTELRDIEEILISRGGLALPGLVVAISESTLPYASRRVAARALSRLSPKHLETICDEVVAGEIGRMEDLAHRIEALSVSPDATGLLVDYYREQLQTSLELALEILALVGAVPDFDLIAASLQSSSAKVRANALETINTSLDYPTYRRIAAVIEPEGLHRKSKVSNNSAQTCMLDILEQAVGQGDALEAAAAAEALGRLHPDRFQSAARVRLAAGDAALVGEVVESRERLDPASVLNLIRDLRRNPDFASTRLSTLLTLVRGPGRSTGNKLALEARANTIAPSHADLALNFFGARCVPK